MQRKWLLRALGAALLALVLFGAYYGVQQVFARNSLTWRDLAASRPAPAPLLLSLALLIGVYVWHALLWGRIVRDLGIGKPAPGTSVRIFFVAGVARYIPFVKMAALAGVAVLSKRAGMPPLSAAAAAVLGQFAFLSTGMIFLGTTLPEWRNVEGWSAAPAGLPLAVGATLLVVAAAALWVVVSTPMGHGFRALLMRRLGNRAGERLGAAFALADRVRPADALVWALAYGASWALLGVAFLVFVGSFAPEAWEHMRFVGGTVAAAYLLGYLFFILPAGLGAREAVMYALLSPVISPAPAIVVSVASRVWFTAAELIPLAALPVMGAEPKLEREDG